jgi:hypothetical protein
MPGYAITDEELAAELRRLFALELRPPDYENDPDAEWDPDYEYLVVLLDELRRRLTQHLTEDPTVVPATPQLDEPPYRLADYVYSDDPGPRPVPI